ncbi:glycosyltransferase family 2 protein [Oleiharenicola sp. Vm1]|uniref:glycosyltransferase family 2 protein n=1 Tax=Oleiharenicola sp. Vm1 TaxID=3398393 RepID=UPI0039F571DE
MSVAIVIPVLNQLAYTQGCVRCLQPDLAAGVQVIVVDNGSTDGTREWLAAQPALTVIRNEQNRGCAPAWNQGIAAAGILRNAPDSPAPGQESILRNTQNWPAGTDAPEWVVVLNNDVRLPAGWLAALLGAAERHGLDIACPAMRERDANYDFESYARDFSAKLGGVVRRGGAHGVCFAVRRAVFARIGGFDEAFRIGQFEDADFFRRARQAGFRTGVVGACFIHHFGSVTQDALSDTKKQRPYEAENRAYFRKKWKLGWARRRWEKAADGLRAWWWRTTERARFGHSLHEKWDGERLRFY